MATVEDRINAMQLEINGLMTREQGQQLIQDSNARELAHRQQGLDMEEKFRKMEEMLEGMKTRITNTEAKGTDERKCIGYINMKNKEPKVFGEKPDDWKKWKDDMGDFLDAHNPGIKKLLKEIAETKEEISDEWKNARNQKYEQRLLKDGDKVWNTLRQLTNVDARKIVMSTKDENGFTSWQNLIRTMKKIGSQKEPNADGVQQHVG